MFRAKEGESLHLGALSRYVCMLMDRAVAVRSAPYWGRARRARVERRMGCGGATGGTTGGRHGGSPRGRGRRGHGGAVVAVARPQRRLVAQEGKRQCHRAPRERVAFDRGAGGSGDQHAGTPVQSSEARRLCFRRTGDRHVRPTSGTARPNRFAGLRRGKLASSRTPRGGLFACAARGSHDTGPRASVTGCSPAYRRTVRNSRPVELRQGTLDARGS